MEARLQIGGKVDSGRPAHSQYGSTCAVEGQESNPIGRIDAKALTVTISRD
jgi:hypothetical protein